MNQDGKQDDEEHHVEEIIGKRDAGTDRHDRKRDGSRSAHACKRNEQALIPRTVQGCQKKEDSCGTCGKGQKQCSQKGAEGNRRKTGRESKQAEQEKQQHLHETGEGVKESDTFRFIRNRMIADHNAGNIHC